MHIPPPGPQRMRCNSLIFGWTLILVGLLLFPIGGFLLMAGGVALLAYAHKLKRLLSDTETSQASPAVDSIVNPIAVQQPVPARAPSALDKPFGDTFPISVWIDDAPFVVNGRVSLYVMDKHKAAIRRIVRADDSFTPQGNGGSGAVATWGTLVPEPTNRHDPDAVRVEVDGQSVGYLALDWKYYAHETLAAARGNVASDAFPLPSTPKAPQKQHFPCTHHKKLPRAPASASRELCVALRLAPHFWCQKYQCCFTMAFMCASN